MTAVDLDLDVVRRTDGTVYVDDEDEFAEHRVSFGYPPEVVELAEESCRWVLGHVRDRHRPVRRRRRGLDGPRPAALTCPRRPRRLSGHARRA